MATLYFPLPDVGEGLTEAEIVAWKVSPGQQVHLNQVLVEIETAKSVVELPSPSEGVVGELLVREGEVVLVGANIITLLQEADADSKTPNGGDGTDLVQPESEHVSEPALTDQESDSGSVLVGYGTSKAPTTRRRERMPHPAVVALESVLPVSSSEGVGASAATLAAPVLAKPPARKLAKDLGVDLTTVTPTGPIGDVTREDVLREAKQTQVFRNIQTPELPDDREERIPVRGVRKEIASAMVKSAFTAPHVSLFVDVDATRTMEFVKRLKTAPDFSAVKISPLLVLAKAMVWAVRRNSMVNAQWTESEIIVRHYVNLGIAAATPRGLIVPNIKDAHEMSLLELAKALEELTLTARAGKTSPSSMAGGTITITNIGVFGMDTGTPILNPGEAAIVALGAIKQKPWVVDGEVRSRFVTTLGASFDHRIVDGDVASRFVADVASILEEPALLLE